MEKLEKITIHKELLEVLEKLEHPIAEKIIEHKINIEGKYINYLGKSHSNEGYISYLTKDRVGKLPETEFWDCKKRYHKSPAGVVELLFPKEFTQRDKEIFTEKYRNILKQDEVDLSGIVLVEGEEIRRCYYENNYDTRESGGSLFCSCMRYHKCQKFFDIYCKNTNHVSLAVLYNENKEVRGRCIIWYPNGKGAGPVYYDRIYGNTNSLEQEMQAMLDKMGFVNISDKNVIKPNSYSEISIKLDFGEEEISYFPYMDTMCYISGRYISSESDGDSSEMRNQDGTVDDNRSYCECCEDRYHEDDLITICAGDHRGEAFCTECAVYSTYHHGYIAEEDSVELDNGDYALSENTVTTYDGSTILEDRAVELYNGKYAQEYDSDLLESEDGDYFIKGDENFVKIAGEDSYYHMDSGDIEEIEGKYYVIGSDQYEEALLSLEEEA